jgi:Na+/phosphate symporter
MIVLLPLLVALIGLVAYAISTNPKVSELGRISFFCGLLAFLLQSAPHVVSWLK